MSNDFASSLFPPTEHTGLSEPVNGSPEPITDVTPELEAATIEILNTPTIDEYEIYLHEEVVKAQAGRGISDIPANDHEPYYTALHRLQAHLHNKKGN